MKVRDVKNIASSALMGLLLVSTLVIAGSQSSYVNAIGQPSEGSIPASTISNEVNGASGSNRFVVWADDESTNPYEIVPDDIFFKRSTDNGATWKATVNLSSNPGDSSNPVIAVSGSNVYVAWLQGSAIDTSFTSIIFRKSTDNGVTWGSKVKIASFCYGCLVSVPQISASGTNLYVLFATGSSADVNSADVYLRQSTDSGTTWKASVNLSNNPGRSYDSMMVVSTSTVFVTWTQDNTDRTSSDIFFRRSIDAGATWKSKVNLSNDPAPTSDAQIAASGSEVHVVWVGSDEILYKRSTDSGATWKIVKKLSNTQDGRHAWAPQIVTVGTSVYVAWNDLSNWEDSAAFLFRRSTDNGSTWKAIVNVGSENDGTYITEFAASGSNVFLVWQDTYWAKIFFSRSTDNGQTWSPADNLYHICENTQSNAQLAVSGTMVFIVCSSGHLNGSNLDIFFARSIDSGGTWKPTVNLSKNTGESNTPQIAI